MQDKIAVIDMAFHKKTKSFHFFLDILFDAYGRGNVDLFYDNSLEGGEVDRGYIENKGRYKTFVFLQIPPNPAILYALKGKNIIYVPMYDGFIFRKYLWIYLKHFGVKIVSFSLKVHNFFYDILGLKSLYIQYYLDPLSYDVNYEKKNIYWRYRGSVGWNDIKTILGDQKIDRLTIKNMPDPGYRKLEFTQEDIQKYNIDIIDTFFPTHEEHYRNLAEHNIFIAPRRQEGIGMSFLDALSLGMCVVGSNDATMNEYIVDGENGILTNRLGLTLLDGFHKFGKMAKARYIKGYEEWRRSNKSIISLINSRNIKHKVPIIMLCYSIINYYGFLIIRSIYIFFYRKRSSVSLISKIENE